MTDRPTPHPSASDDDLELASAYLDGEATPDEVALVEGDPMLRALVEDLRVVARGLDPGLPPADLLDRHLGSALAAYDEQGGSCPVPVSDLTAARADRARSRWYDRIPLGAVAAAVLLVALVGGLSLVDSGDDRSDTAAGVAADSAGDDESTAFEESGAAVDGGDAGTLDSAAGGGALAPSAADGRPAFVDLEALAAFVSGAQARTGAPTSTAMEDASQGQEGSVQPDAACDLLAVASAAAGPGALQTVVGAVVAGQPVTAFVIETSEGPQLVVVDETTCSVVDQRPLDA